MMENIVEYWYHYLFFIILSWIAVFFLAKRIGHLIRSNDKYLTFDLVDEKRNFNIVLLIASISTAVFIISWL